MTWRQLNTMNSDGYTIVGVNLPHIILQPLRGAKYKTRDIATAHIFHYTPHALLVRRESHYKNLKDLIATMNTKPGTVSFPDRVGDERTILPKPGSTSDYKHALPIRRTKDPPRPWPRCCRKRLTQAGHIRRLH